MKIFGWFLFTVIVCLVFLGCEKASDSELFVVDMQKDKPLVYKMVSERQIVVDLDPSGKMSKGKSASTAWQMTETLDITAEITLKQVDSNGYLVLEAYYSEVKVSRKGKKNTSSGKDAVEYLQGKRVSFKITPAGLLVETDELVKLIQSLGEKAFSGSKADAKNIKNQDMISDFLALQWFMFDPLAKIEDPVAGITKGQSWNSTVTVPTPSELFLGRDITYTLEDVYQENGKTKALIKTASSLAKKKPDVPLIYSGKSYSQRGFFGVLRCKPISLEGQGEIVYDLDRGILEKNFQEYNLETTAVLFIPLPGTENGRMKINQKLTTELLKD